MKQHIGYALAVSPAIFGLSLFACLFAWSVYDFHATKKMEAKAEEAKHRPYHIDCERPYVSRDVDNYSIGSNNGALYFTIDRIEYVATHTSCIAREN